MTGNRTADELLWRDCCVEAFESFEILAKPWSPPSPKPGEHRRMFGYSRLYLSTAGKEPFSPRKEIGHVTLTKVGTMEFDRGQNLPNVIHLVKARAIVLFNEIRKAEQTSGSGVVQR